jgi:hypothetical protein
MLEESSKRFPNYYYIKMMECDVVSSMLDDFYKWTLDIPHDIITILCLTYQLDLSFLFTGLFLRHIYICSFYSVCAFRLSFSFFPVIDICYSFPFILINNFDTRYLHCLLAPSRRDMEIQETGTKVGQELFFARQG